MSDKQDCHSPSNEGKVCDAVVKLLEQRTGETRTDIRFPEKDGGSPPVELRLKLGAQEYALEHTQVEAFGGQIATGVSLKELIASVKKALTGKLPGPAHYELFFPTNPSLRVTKMELEKLQKDLIEWVDENARLLHTKIQERISGKPTPVITQRDTRDSIKANPPKFPYEIELCCRVISSQSGQESGILYPSRQSPDDLEGLRAERLRQALFRKSPKLQRCKEEGARTVLVLESDDIALTNHQLVGEALNSLLKETAEKFQFPDEIYLVETDIDPWSIWPMKYGAECRPVENWAEWTGTEFHVDSLTNITK